MQYIITVAAIAVLSFALGFLAMFIVRRLRNKPMKNHIYVLLSLGLSLTLCTCAAAIYLGVHYVSGEAAAQALKSAEDVEVREIDGGIFFDGSGTEAAMIFYPGAKVESEAYAPLMKKIAARGIDCFVVKPPFRMAIFNMNAAEKVMDSYDYPVWVVGGHSMGALAASGFAASHSGEVDGLILLAGYPMNRVPDSVYTISIYGTNDGVLDRGAYDNGRSLLPKNHLEIEIEGGNHSQFGDYGKQQEDKDATLSSDEQQERTAQAVQDMVEKILK